MADPRLLVIAAFVLGYLSRPWLDLVIHHARRQWYQNRPTWCGLCGQRHRLCNMKMAQHRTAGWTLLCRTCWEEYYHPFDQHGADNGQSHPGRQ